MSRPVVLGITGASGAAYGLRLLELLAELRVETHLVVTEPGAQVIAHETGLSVDRLATGTEGGEATVRSWAIDDLFAPIASGTYLTEGMVVAPCSIRTLSAVACARSSNLLERAADVTLKQRRPLVLMVRETPLHLTHLRLMVQAAEAGAIIMPPVPAFYGKPKTIEELVDDTAARALDLLGLDHDLLQRWGE